MTDMSMLSAQCDELRSMSESVGLAMPQAATLMVEASDTIDRLDAENAKLREENQSIGLAAYELGRKSMAGENAKLRELCVDMYRCSDPCNDCPHYNGSSSDFYCRLGIGWKARRMRELGIEVD